MILRIVFAYFLSTSVWVYFGPPSISNSSLVCPFFLRYIVFLIISWSLNHLPIIFPAWCSLAVFSPLTILLSRPLSLFQFFSIFYLRPSVSFISISLSLQILFIKALKTSTQWIYFSGSSWTFIFKSLSKSRASTFLITIYFSILNKYLSCYFIFLAPSFST